MSSIEVSFIDTHSHWYLPEFDNDRDEALCSALSNSINKIVVANVDNTTTEPMLKLVENYPEKVYAALGLHPCSVGEDWETQVDKMLPYFSKTKFIAIGEIGIDLYWDKTWIAEQKLAFRKQIEWALEKNLPVIIHSRNSMNEVMEITKDYKNLRGVYHCFPGSIEQAKKVVEQGFYLGIGGVVTYKNAGMQKVVQEIPLNHILLETDAPYLTPAPHRGKRNTSEFLIHIAEKIAAIKNIHLSEVARVTSENAHLLFGL